MRTLYARAVLVSFYLRILRGLSRFCFVFVARSEDQVERKIGGGGLLGEVASRRKRTALPSSVLHVTNTVCVRYAVKT